MPHCFKTDILIHRRKLDKIVPLGVIFILRSLSLDHRWAKKIQLFPLLEKEIIHHNRQVCLFVQWNFILQYPLQVIFSSFYHPYCRRNIIVQWRKCLLLLQKVDYLFLKTLKNATFYVDCVLHLVDLMFFSIYYLSQLMRLWHFSSSVNSFFKRACAAIQWG